MLAYTLEARKVAAMSTYLDPEDDHSQVSVGRDFETCVGADQELKAPGQVNTL